MRDGKEALLAVFQIAGIEIQSFQKALDAILRFAKFDHRAAQCGQRGIKRLASVSGNRLKPALRLAHRAFGAFR